MAADSLHALCPAIIQGTAVPLSSGALVCANKLPRVFTPTLHKISCLIPGGLPREARARTPTLKIPTRAPTLMICSFLMTGAFAIGMLLDFLQEISYDVNVYARSRSGNADRSQEENHE